jgi:hypothetical protein
MGRFFTLFARFGPRIAPLRRLGRFQGLGQIHKSAPSPPTPTGSDFQTRPGVPFGVAPPSALGDDESASLRGLASWDFRDGISSITGNGDYLAWPEDMCFEVIDGIAYALRPAATVSHQEVVLVYRLENGRYGRPDPRGHRRDGTRGSAGRAHRLEARHAAATTRVTPEPSGSDPA